MWGTRGGVQGDRKGRNGINYPVNGFLPRATLGGLALQGLVGAPPKLRLVWGHGFRFLSPSTLGQFGHVGTKGNRSIVDKDGAECLTRGPVYLALGFGGLFWAVREATIYGAPSAAHLIFFRTHPTHPMRVNFGAPWTE